MLAQLVERNDGIVEVNGSIPLHSIFFKGVFMSFFDTIDTLPEDPIFGLQAAFIADKRPDKINLAMGVYKDSNGQSTVLTAVQKAEKRILEQSLNKDYLPIAGDKEYIAETAKLIFGDHPKISEGSIFGAQTIGGTAALRVAGEFLARNHPNKSIYLPNMTWANHKLIFQMSGLKVDVYPYYDHVTHTFDFQKMCQKIRQMEKGSIIVLHGTPHNPTGLNPTLDQWKELSALIKSKEIIPFMDLAYQGFGTSLEVDAEPVRYFVNDGHEFFVSYTYSKNMGLYGERAGALFAVMNDPKITSKVASHLKPVIRSLYSNPSLQGARIVTTVLKDEQLKKEWVVELGNMKERINEMRKAFVLGLLSKESSTHYQFLDQLQTGLFIYTALDESQVQRLKNEFGIYLPEGRINLAGLNSTNIDYVIASILAL